MPLPSNAINIEKIEALLKHKNVPALSMVFIDNGKINSQYVFGVKNYLTLEPITKDTRFEAASLSKPVFAYAILKAVELGILNLDTPLTKYLLYPGLVNDRRIDLVTARMILSHSSGFPNWHPKDRPLNLLYSPGKKFSYAGESFAYLQTVIEQLTQLSLEQFMQELVFIPLNMTSSTFEWLDNHSKASGHDLTGMPVENDKNRSPHAAFTLHTTALDYAKFVATCLEETDCTATLFNQMTFPQIQTHSMQISWGLGWGLQKTIRGPSFWHWGDSQYFRNFVFGFKEHKQAWIIFTNGAKGQSVISEIIQKHLQIKLPAFEWIHQLYFS